MTDEQMKKLLEEDTGEVPERFHQAMLAAFGQMEDEPFDGTELPISVEAAEKPRRPRHVPRQGGRFRRMMLVIGSRDDGESAAAGSVLGQGF